MSDAHKPKIKLERGAPDRLVPKDFTRTVYKRYLPILGLTYALSVLGVAGHGDDFVHTLFSTKKPYIIGLVIGVWASIPAFVWVILKGTAQFSHVADDWYKIIATLVTVILLLSFILLPELNMLGVRTYLAASVPLFGLIYLFFVRENLPSSLTYPLTGLGFIFLLMGAAVSIMY